MLVTAFEGWNDAGDAASGAARWLIHRHGAEQVATLESEEFFDFTTTRPLVEQTEAGDRRIVWPDTELWTATTSTERDLAILVGHEPHLRWRTWSRAVVELAQSLDVSMVITVPLATLLSLWNITPCCPLATGLHEFAAVPDDGRSATPLRCNWLRSADTMNSSTTHVFASGSIYDLSTVLSVREFGSSVRKPSVCVPV